MESEALQVLDAFMEAFNARDGEAWKATLHYPHVRLAGGGDVTVWNTPEDFHVDLDAFAKRTGWHHSVWNRRKLITQSDNKVHFDTQFTRYKENGEVLATYESIYTVTKKDGRWGVQARSSFAP